MKKIFYNYIPLFFFLLSSCSFSAQDKNWLLNPERFAAQINETENATIVDVRTPKEFEKGHISHALNIDWKADDFNAKSAALSKSEPIFVYCLSGGRSSAAAKKLRADGFKTVYELEGGMMQWRSMNMPEIAAVKNQGMSKNDFLKQLQSDKIIIVDFYADWCAPCKKLKPILEALSKEMSNKINVVRINADDNQLLCKEIGIDALPVIEIYKNQTLLFHNKGLMSKEELIAKINSVH